MPTSSTILLAALFGPLAGAVTAECLHNGEAVEEGTRIGGLVCKDGAWVEREPDAE